MFKKLFLDYTWIFVDFKNHSYPQSFLNILFPGLKTIFEKIFYENAFHFS